MFVAKSIANGLPVLMCKFRWSMLKALWRDLYALTSTMAWIT